MELQNAISLISTIASNKQQEVDALNLAVKILQDKFVPELTRMLNAEAQVQSINQSLIDTNNEKITLQNTLETKEVEISNLTIEKINETERANLAEATIVEKENEITELKEQVKPVVELPVEEITP